ncbi:hypothetical protein VPH35_110855 [Triticum aestivum]|uniref:uncharacterized protein isoform X1 n=1 Tax=Triticum aestivum TaxID=4565 RepID=UPI000844732B|nr:uncharacterized protein LOC123137121 isoform X1 [Triticum aestivum]
MDGVRAPPVPLAVAVPPRRHPSPRLGGTRGAGAAASHASSVSHGGPNTASSCSVGARRPRSSWGRRSSSRGAWPRSGIDERRGAAAITPRHKSFPVSSVCTSPQAATGCRRGHLCIIVDGMKGATATTACCSGAERLRTYSETVLDPYVLLCQSSSRRNLLLLAAPDAGAQKPDATVDDDSYYTGGAYYYVQAADDDQE